MMIAITNDFFNCRWKGPPPFWSLHGLLLRPFDFTIDHLRVLEPEVKHPPLPILRPVHFGPGWLQPYGSLGPARGRRQLRSRLFWAVWQNGGRDARRVFQRKGRRAEDRVFVPEKILLIDIIIVRNAEWWARNTFASKNYFHLSRKVDGNSLRDQLHAPRWGRW